MVGVLWTLFWNSIPPPPPQSAEHQLVTLPFDQTSQLCFPAKLRHFPSTWCFFFWGGGSARGFKEKLGVEEELEGSQRGKIKVLLSTYRVHPLSNYSLLRSPGIKELASVSSGGHSQVTYVAAAPPPKAESRHF